MSDRREGVQSYGAEKRFSAATMARWLTLDAADSTALLDVAVQLRLGENHFRDVLEYAEDIAARSGSSIGAVLSRPEVCAVLQRGLGRNETLKELKAVLRRQRYPQLAATEAALARAVSALALPAGVRIVLPENLEGATVTLTLQASTPEELRARAQALAMVCRDAPVDELFRLLEGNW